MQSSTETSQQKLESPAMASSQELMTSQNENSMINLFVNGNPLEIQIYLNKETMDLTDNCVQLQNVSNLMEERLNILFNNSFFTNFKNNTYFKTSEYKETTPEVQKAIKDFEEDLCNLEAIFSDFTSGNQKFTDTIETIVLSLKMWLNDIAKILEIEGDLQSFNADPKISTQIEKLQQIEQKFLQCVAAVKEISRKGYHTILKDIFPAEIKKNDQIFDHFKDNDYKQLHELWLCFTFIEIKNIFLKLFQLQIFVCLFV